MFLNNIKNKLITSDQLINAYMLGIFPMSDSRANKKFYFVDPKFRAVIPVEAADYAPGFYLDWWRHPHANAAQVCASGTWDLMAPQSPEIDRWLTWHYYTQGSEAFKGDLYFYSVDHDLRKELQNIDGHKCPVIMLTGTYDYLTPPEATENTARQIKGGVYIEMPDIGHFPMSENHEVFRVYLMEALKIIQERTSK